MKHPNSDEWARFVCGEASPDKRRELQQHLDSCPGCAAEIAGWEMAIGKLSSWRVPSRRPRAVRVPHWIKWAAAAAILVGVALGSGKLLVSRAEASAMRKELEQTIRASIVAELRTALQRELAQGISLAAETSKRESERISNELLQLLHDTRDEDRRATLALVQQVRKQQASDYLSLRRDLETVASSTDDEIRRARMSLIQFVANAETAKNFDKH